MDTHKNKEVIDRGGERARIVNEQAALWLVLYMDEPAMNWSHRMRFLTWLLRSPDHVAAFLSIYNLDGWLGRHKLRSVVSAESNANAPDAAPEVLPKNELRAAVAPVHEKRNQRINRKTGQRWKFAAMAAGVALTILLAIATREPRIDDMVSTAPGQHQHIELPDGSVTHVGASSQLRIVFNGEQRVVHVYHGEAVFDVEKDPARPFTVITPVIDVTAVGTRFGVAMNVDVVATVSEGVVEIAAHDNPDTAEVTLLRAGQQLRVSDNALTQATVATVDATRTLEWADGWLTIGGTQTLGEVVQEFNRHNVAQIEIEQPAMAALKRERIYRYRLDSFLAGSSTRLAQTIATTYGLDLIEDRTGKVTRLRLVERRH